MPAPQGQLVEIGEVAARNIVARLKLDTDKGEAEVGKLVGTVKAAIRDEINAMSSHFTLAVHDVQTQYEAEVLRIKSDFNWVKANKVKIAAVVSAVFVIATLIGHFL